MDEKINARLAQAVVLLDRQYRMLKRVYDNACATLTHLRVTMDSGAADFEVALDVYNHVLSLIDNLARYRKTAFSIPCLNQKSPEYRALTTAMGDIMDARNQLQHLNNDIENDNTGPLLGGIGWVDNKRNYVIALNDVGRWRSVPGIAFDTKEKRYVSDFCFTYGNKLFDLAKAMSGAREFNAYVTDTVQIEIDGKPYIANQHFMAISAAFLTGAEVAALAGEQGETITAQISGT